MCASLAQATPRLFLLILADEVMVRNVGVNWVILLGHLHVGEGEMGVWWRHLVLYLYRQDKTCIRRALSTRKVDRLGCDVTLAVMKHVDAWND